MIRFRLRVWEEEQSREEGQLNKKSKKPPHAKLEEDWEHDVKPDFCRFPRLVRDYLDSGVLVDLIKKHIPKKKSDEWTGLIVITYCAMELGCTLPPGFRDLLKKECWGPHLSAVGHHQIYRACEEYVDGKPFSFSSLDTRTIARITLREKGISMDSKLGRHTQRPPPTPPGLEPIPSQEAVAATDEPVYESIEVDDEFSPPLPVEQYHFDFPIDTCANCGATRGYGTPELRRCKRCRITLYCFEGCQRWHLNRHKLECGYSEDDEDEEESVSEESNS